MMAALGRRADIATMNPETAWQQPMLRLIDSVFGIAVGVVCKWSSSPFLGRT